MEEATLSEKSEKSPRDSDVMLDEYVVGSKKIVPMRIEKPGQPLVNPSKGSQPNPQSGLEYEDRDNSNSPHLFNEGNSNINNSTLRTLKGTLPYPSRTLEEGRRREEEEGKLEREEMSLVNKQILEYKDLRATSVYLPKKLWKLLKLRCIAEEQEISRVLSYLVGKYLNTPVLFPAVPRKGSLRSEIECREIRRQLSQFKAARTPEQRAIFMEIIEKLVLRMRGKLPTTLEKAIREALNGEKEV